MVSECVAMIGAYGLSLYEGLIEPAGRIPVIIDNTVSPPFPVMETSAELLYLLKEHDKNDVFGFKDDYERNQCLQWLFFWHGSVRLKHSLSHASPLIPNRALHTRAN